MDFFDSNVLIAALVEKHEHHARCRVRLEKLKGGLASCSAHSLAESFNTLTSHRRGYGLDPGEAAGILNDVASSFKLVTLSQREVLRTIEDTALLGLAGAIIYDALIVACARKVDARRIYAMNVKYFRQVAPDLTAHIVEP